ncbi:hypothetical protein MVEN_00955700 [Mycena venus]|uniref:Uncharacterized protein n=1 Tax=Mycena venus TaxID=2733690 RepID=A0A8H6YD08_9AGAR|nr:hypothetical protein MVEN_00955700 [Mycena venus]
MIIFSDEFSKQLALEQIPHIEVRINTCPHQCVQCSSEKSAFSPHFLEHRMSWGRRLLYSSACISSCIFILSLAEFCAAGHRNRFTGIFQISVALSSFATSLILMILLRLGRTPGSQQRLARTDSQMFVLCGLGLTWIGFVCTLVAINEEVCRRDSTGVCFLFVIENILCWSLFITMFGAAYAMYRRAVTLHGNEMVPMPNPPPLVPAWRLSHISDSAGHPEKRFIS